MSSANEGNTRSVMSCRRDLQIAPRPCADPAVCGAFCTNSRVAEWKSFRGDRASQPAVQRRRLERGQMIQTVLHVLRVQFRVCLVSVSQISSHRVSLKETSSVRLLVHVAKHIELLMYRAAFSKTEYSTLATVSRRVHHFAMVMNCNSRWKVKLLPRQQQVRIDATSTTSGSKTENSLDSQEIEQRRRNVWLFTPAWWGSRDSHSMIPLHQGVIINGNDKSYRSLTATTENHSLREASSVKGFAVSTNPVSTVRAFFDGFETPVLVNIFSFLPGQAVVRCLAINRLCYRELPRAITNLCVSTTGLTSLLSQLEVRLAQDSSRAVSVLLPNLRDLSVVPDQRSSMSSTVPPSASTLQPSLNALGKRRRPKSPAPIPLQTNERQGKETQTVPHAATTSSQQTPTRISGELAILALGRHIQARNLPKLRKLSLCATFVNTVTRNGIFVLTEALSTSGACADLESIWLGGNALGDYGAMCVAKLLASGSCPKIIFLDLRSNYIGHDGIASLTHAFKDLSDRCQIEQLCLGSNLLSSECVSELTRCVENGALQKLQFLGLDGNFLSPASLSPLANALIRGACPKLRELCIGGNTELSRSAISSAFKEAADRTDGTSWGLFRPSGKRRRVD